MVPYFAAKAPLYDFLETELGHYTATERTTFKPEGGLTYFDSTTVNMEAFTSKSALFDLYFALGIIAYLFAMTSYFKGVQAAIQIFKSAAMSILGRRKTQ